METALTLLAILAALLWAVLRVRSRLCSSRGPGCASACGGCAASSGGCAVPERRPGSRTLPVLGLAAALGAAAPAHALGTIETWAPGAADFESNIGVSGLGGGRARQAVGSDLQLGYGIADKVSAYLGLGLQGNGFLADAEPAVRLGAFTTVIDGDLFKLDLLLEVGGDGPGLSTLHLLPQTELNFDFTTAAGKLGAYLRAGLRLSGQRRAGDGDPSWETVRLLQLTPGLSYIPREGHRFLVESGGAFHFACSQEPFHWEHAGVAVGYNHVVSPQLELISQLSVAPHPGDGQAVVGALVGFIATVPAGRP